MDNQEVIDALFERIHEHYFLHGLSVNMTHWTCIHRQYFDILIDGELVGIEPVDFTDFFPVGEYRCGTCSSMCQFNEKQFAYFDPDNAFMICCSCYKKTPRIYQKMWCRVVGIPQLESVDDVKIIHRRLNDQRKQIMYTKIAKKAQRTAMRLHKHFFDGMCTTDIWHMILAKRVIRAFRRTVLRRKVAYIIYKCADVNAITAESIAKRCL